MSRHSKRRWGSLPVLPWRMPGCCALAGAALVSACGGSSERVDAEPPEPPAASVTAPGATPAPAEGAAVDPGDADGATEVEPVGGDAEGVGDGIELDPNEAVADGAAAGDLDPGDTEPADTEPGDAEPGDAEPGDAEPAPAAVTVYLAGDSIVQTYADGPSERDQAGWGQMLAPLLDPNVTVVNRAIGGRTARRFIDEGRLSQIVDELEPGHFLLVQFGTNDGNRSATYTLGDETIPYFLDPATDFKLYLQRYVDAAQSRGATPVLVTPTPRNSAYCTGGNGTGGHAAAMRELGADSGVAVIDLNAKAVAYLREICPAPTPEDFFLLRADGTVDGTHFQENGARILAGFVAEGLREAGLPLAARR